MTGDPLPVLLSFIIGLVIGLAVQETSAYYKAKWWLMDRSPRQCPRCKAWRQRCNTRDARHTVGGWTRICRKCYDELYNPSQRS